MDRRKVYKVPRVVENKVKEINDLIRWVQDKDNIVGGYFGSTYYEYLDFEKPIEIRNQFVYIEYYKGGVKGKVKERYNFNQETGYNSLEELKWELSRILRAFRKAKKDYDTKGYFQKGGGLKDSKKKPKVAKKQKGRSFEDAYGRFKDDIRKNMTPRKMAKGGKISHLGRAYLGELWFAVHEKNTSKYKSLANKLDREGVPMYIQNRVSSDASGTTKKAIDTAEVKDRIDKIVAQKMAKGGKFADGGEIQMSKVYNVNGKDYLFSTPIQNEKGTYTGWDAYEVVYDTFDGEKHLNYTKTKRGKSKYFPNGVKRTEAEDYFAKGGKIDEKIKILKKEGYPHKQAVAIALSMRDSGKLARGGEIAERIRLDSLTKMQKLEDKELQKNEIVSFSFNTDNLTLEDAIEMVEVYTKNWQSSGDESETSLFVTLPKRKAKELLLDLRGEDVYDVEVRESRYARGGEVENEMTDADWDKIFGGLDKEPTQEEIELSNIEQKENEKQIRNNFAKHLGYGVSWDKVVLDLVKDTKFMISNTNNASLGENNNTRSYIFENIKHLKRLRYGAEKYANMLLELHQKKLDSLRKRN